MATCRVRELHNTKKIYTMVPPPCRVPRTVNSPKAPLSSSEGVVKMNNMIMRMKATMSKLRASSNK